MRRRMHLIIIGLFFLAGLGLALYPMISNWYMGRHQASVVADYDEVSARLSQKKIKEELEKAREYNVSLLGNVVLTDPFDEKGLQEQNKEYEELLDLGGDGVMASVEIPDIDVYLPIYHGTSSEVLKKGIGHLQNSSLPVGGTGTHVVVSGHTALPSAEMFNRLSDLEIKDVFFIHVLNETLAYEINQIKVVRPEDISDLLIDKDKDYVTLVTCTPYGINSHRLLVRGIRIPYEETGEISESRDDAVKKNAGLWKVSLLIMALAGILLATGFCIWRKKRAGGRGAHEE